VGWETQEREGLEQNEKEENEIWVGNVADDEGNGVLEDGEDGGRCEREAGGGKARLSAPGASFSISRCCICLLLCVRILILPTTTETIRPVLPRGPWQLTQSEHNYSTTS